MLLIASKKKPLETSKINFCVTRPHEKKWCRSGEEARAGGWRPIQARRQ